LGIVRSLPEVESWLFNASESWRSLSDSQYRVLVGDWNAKFRRLIEHDEPTRTGNRALDAIAEHLPADVVLFSGIRVAEVANLGGSCACGYHAVRLRSLDHALLRRNELIACAPDLSWTCLFSHETGSMFHEQLYGLLESAV